MATKSAAGDAGGALGAALVSAIYTLIQKRIVSTEPAY